jgi:hypothetical protein
MMREKVALRDAERLSFLRPTSHVTARYEGCAAECSRIEFYIRDRTR